MQDMHRPGYSRSAAPTVLDLLDLQLRQVAGDEGRKDAAGVADLHIQICINTRTILPGHSGERKRLR